MVWLLVGFICLLLVLGAVFTGRPIHFAASGLAITGAVAFVAVIGTIVWVMTTYEGTYVAPLGSTNSASPDPFPFYAPDEQYAWYDRNDVPMSNRCYTTMTTPCSSLQWEQALGVPLSSQEEEVMKLQWCEKFAASWSQSVQECVEEDKVQ